MFLAHVMSETESLVRHLIFYVVVAAVTIIACYASVMYDRSRTARRKTS